MLTINWELNVCACECVNYNLSKNISPNAEQKNFLVN